jgi:hypothetical protein
MVNEILEVLLNDGRGACGRALKPHTAPRPFLSAGLSSLDRTCRFRTVWLSQKHALEIDAVNYPGLKAGASSFTGGCLSSNVLSRSYAASTGCTPGPRGRLVRRQTPLPKQLRRIVANVAPYIPSLKGRGLTAQRIRSAGSDVSDDDAGDAPPPSGSSAGGDP